MHTDMGTSSFEPALAGILALSGGRLGATPGWAVALAGTVVGGRALARSTRRTRSAADGATGPWSGPAAALALGLVGAALGVVLVATADGGLGTGNGLGGAVVAVVLGGTAMVLGALARARDRRTA